MSNLKLAIEVLEKELERTNLLIMAGKMEQNDKKMFPNKKGPPPIYDNGHSTRIQLRDQIEDAIAYLKTKNNGN